MGKSVEMPKNHIVSARLNGDEYATFLRLTKRFGAPSKVLRLALYALDFHSEHVMLSGHREDDHE